MFQDSDLEVHMRTSHTIKTKTLIIGEWNMNDLSNIAIYGNYRYRPYEDGSQYKNLPRSFDIDDLGDYYREADDSKLLSTELFDNDGEPLVFISEDSRRKIYYGLRQCFEKFRPRSGINKVNWRPNKYIDNIKSARRPRYYLAAKDDVFKYWTSYREDVVNNVQIERGISLSTPINTRGQDISDAAPFVVYKETVPTNRIVVKMQTNLGEDEGSASVRLNANTIIPDPLLDRSRSSIPKRWGIEYLDENNIWNIAIQFNEDSTRRDGSPIVPWDGYLELYYGFKIPDEYKESFHFIDYLSSSVLLPPSSYEGDSYIVGATSASAGVLYTWKSGPDNSQSQLNVGEIKQGWVPNDLEYGFYLSEDNDTRRIGIIESLVNPKFYNDPLTNKMIYRDFSMIKGIRVFVETMNGPDTSFDLIEMSPRLRANVTGYVESYDVTKEMYNSETNLPVGGIVPSTGSLQIFNYDNAFSQYNTFNSASGTGSLIYNKLEPNIKFDIYDIVAEVPSASVASSSATIIFDKIVPIKTLYSSNIPNVSNSQDTEIELRDLFFRFEETRCPAMFYTQVSVSYIISMLLDNIGFSNYVFRNISGKPEPVIPYFFVNPETSVAEVLSNIAMATQTSMFFDEYNNFVVMFKEYVLPEEEDRSTDIILAGTSSASVISNIESINYEQASIINDGAINYTTRYIQRAASALSQEMFIDKDKTYSYKPVLLWEVAADENEKQINEITQASAFGLAAVALTTNLSASVPYVENNVVQNTIINLGENVYWLPRFSGYLYANGEIIKYDGIEFSITGVGNVYITSGEEYQDYAGKLKFGGSIFPTGNIKIYNEPYYEEQTLIQPALVGIDPPQTVVRPKNGPVKKHGRGQFDTPIVAHNAGVDAYWSPSDNNVTSQTSITFKNGSSPITISVKDPYARGCNMKSEYIFSSTPTENITYPAFGALTSGVGVTFSGQTSYSHQESQKSTMTGMIKNFMRKRFLHENPDTSVVADLTDGMLQSSALVMQGPKPMPSYINTRDFITYKYKKLVGDYIHFGTRMRIIGALKINGKTQAPVNSSLYYSVTDSSNKVSTVDGGSGGIGIFVNEEKNQGYFYEIVALTEDNIGKYTIKNQAGVVTSVLHNIIFYKIVPSSTGDAIPVKLWGGLFPVIVDSGNFVGQDRIGLEENPTVYDLAVEYEKQGNSNIFYLYFNNKIISIVRDDGLKGSPIIPPNSTMCLFIRGATRCMFENVYALRKNLSKESKFKIADGIGSSFGVSDLTSQSLRKYALSGLINSTYLSGISSEAIPKYNLYFEEFGTIMRECYYFDIKYDQAFPALYAVMAPTLNNERGYTVSGFYSGSYGARFLIFNATDKFINLDDTSGNYLRILGVTFTQNTTRSLTVDQFFNEISDFSSTIRFSDSTLRSPDVADKILTDLKISRHKYGKKDFALESVYIQDPTTARNLMNWIMSKSLRDRKIITAGVFSMPHVQLGDIAKIQYTLPDGIKYVDDSKRFVVMSINHSKTVDDFTTTMKLVEV